MARLEGPAVAALTPAVTRHQLSEMRTTIHRSQIRNFLAGTTSAVIDVESRIHEAECYENRKGFGNTRLLEDCKLNMKP